MPITIGYDVPLAIQWTNWQNGQASVVSYADGEKSKPVNPALLTPPDGLVETWKERAKQYWPDPKPPATGSAAVDVDAVLRNVWDSTLPGSGTQTAPLMLTSAEQLADVENGQFYVLDGRLKQRQR